MPVVQTFEKTLDTDERLAALAAAMNRLPAEAVVRGLTAPDAAPARVNPADRPTPEPATQSIPARIPAPSSATISGTSASSATASTPAPAAAGLVPAVRPVAAASLAPAVRPVTESTPLPTESSPISGMQFPATAPHPNPEAYPDPALTAVAIPAPNPNAFISPALTASTALNLAATIPAPAAATTTFSIPNPAATIPAAGTISPAPSPSTSLSISVPVPEPLVGLLPGGLRRGEAAALATKNQGPDFLALALLAEALKAGLWCAVIGVPELGLAALTGLLGPASQRQGALDRLLLVAEPGEQWAEITATLADGVDLLLTRPATPVRAETAQRVDARLRKGRSAGTRHSAALLVLGGWPTARLALRIARMDWTGLDGIGVTAGTGHLTAGRATVVAQGRATAGRPRVARLWLPDATGAVRSLSDNPGTINPTAVPNRSSQTGHDAPAAIEPAIAAPSLTLVPATSPQPSPSLQPPLPPAATSPSPGSAAPASPSPASPAA